MTQRATPLARPHPPLFVVLSGPSGVGKDAVLSRLKSTERQIDFIITLTTRPHRPQETDGVDYRFVSKPDFESLLSRNELLEYANVYGNWYGVPKQPVRDALKRGRDVMVKVDIQGAATIKKIAPEAVFVFLMPPSLAELEKRLRRRYTESPPDLERRLRAAPGEIEQVKEFDYVVMNNNAGIEQAVADIKAVIAAEKMRVKAREILLC